MSYQIKESIAEQATKTVRKQQRLIFRRIRALKNREKRTGQKSQTPIRTAIARWELDQQFNPYYVRAQAGSLSHAIEAAITAQKYTPRPALDVPIAKDDGGHRQISIYTVPDAAVGTWLHRRLLERNCSRLSEFAFGYRSDRNLNDAIIHIAKAVAASPRLFVVEYDFEKFFDSIDHSYLLEVLKKHFRITTEEMAVLGALLAGKSAVKAEYKRKSFTQRTAGIPQGNTLSLFLANAVCYQLDSALEDLGVTFARFADDIVVVAKSYGEACNAAELILSWSGQSKVKINHKKSHGISLLLAQGKGEIKSKCSITFLGCEISNSGVQPAEKRIKRIKMKIAKVVNQYLVQAPKRGIFNKERIQLDVDWDLIDCVNEIRRIIYGRLSEGDLNDALNGKGVKDPIRSHMSGLRMVGIPDRLRELDGWLVGLLERAYAMRASLVSKLGVKPLALTRKAIISGNWYKNSTLVREPRFPSTFRAWLYMRMMLRSVGVRALPATTYEC